MESIEQINYLKCPVATVYQALTSQSGLGQIWTKKLKVKAELGFLNEFDFDEGYITKFRIVELIENRKIIWECVESDPEWIGTKVSFELNEKDSVTQVTLNHYEWRARTDFYRWCSYNWAILLHRLKAYCEA
ncbi:SRPBCC domain-containing protein [Algoriphagus halophytocola]|uniref:SRPBCC domain-containing protein n=1 Tax=Algoriphagus halophytocola TaxID=2991499 RepID=A0ABY6MI75_9BACT|nr:MULTISPECIES: SRPBCC domain-containing protein [unclassified Algoriphagus]UZD22903.1 SRPBCC domain-containing protein [Algoriphagus sp. TR-M5]WBL44171.1 SRPBCC domain-containing protein [Algoriphagus sp. TR-M9]